MSRSGSKMPLLRFTSICFIEAMWACQTDAKRQFATFVCPAAFRQTTEERPSIDSAPRWFSLLPVRVQTIAATASLRSVQFQPEIVPAEEPVEGAFALVHTPRVGRGCGYAARQAETVVCARWAVGRSPRVRRYAYRIRCCQWAAVDPACGCPVRPPANATPSWPRSYNLPCPVARPLTIRA